MSIETLRKFHNFGIICGRMKTEGLINYLSVLKNIKNEDCI